MADAEKTPFVLPDEAVTNAKAQPQEAPDQGFRLPDDVITVPKDGEHERSLLERGSEALRILRGAAPDVNYDHSANETTQYWFSQADSPQEAAKFLNDNYGPGNFGQDTDGTWIVKEHGGWVPVMSEGTIPKFMNRQVAQTAGQAPSVIGGIAGSLEAAGAVARKYPNPWVKLAAGALGAAGGAMAGKGIMEGMKYAKGFHIATMEDEMWRLAKEGGINAGLDVAGSLAGMGAKSVWNKFRSYATSPASRALTRVATDRGYTLPPQASAPNLKALQYDYMRNIAIAGDPYEAKNTALLLSDIRKAMRAEGMSHDEIKKELADIFEGTTALSSHEAGKVITGKAQELYKSDLATAESTKEKAQNALMRQLNNLSSWVFRPGSKDGSLAKKISDAILRERAKFGKQMSAGYAAADRLAGNTPIVPAAGIIDAAKELADRLGKIFHTDEIPPIVKQWANMPKFTLEYGGPGVGMFRKETRLTFSEAHELRSYMRDAADWASVQNITKTRSEHFAGEVAASVDDALDMMVDSSEGFDMQISEMLGHDTGLPEEALAKLRETDQLYAEGRPKFDDIFLRQLAGSVKTTLKPDARAIARLFMRPGRLEAFKEVVGYLPKDTVESIAAADAQNMIIKASHISKESGNRMLDGLSLLGQIQDPERRALMKIVYPADKLAELDSVARQFAALDGQVDLKALDFARGKATLDGSIDTIKKAVEAEKDLHFWAEQHPLAAFASGDAHAIDTAAAAVTQPGKTETTLNAMKWMGGADSPEWKLVRQYFFKKALHSAVEMDKSGTMKVEGDAIFSFLKQYTAEQQRALLGDARDDLILIGKIARAVFAGDTKDMAAMFSAASVKGHIPLHWKADMQWAYARLIGYLAGRPALLRYLGNMPEKEATGTFSRMIKMLMLNKIPGPASKSFIQEQFEGPGSDLPGPEWETKPATPTTPPAQVPGPGQRTDLGTGRFGDTELVHVNPKEKAMLMAAGGSGTINPATGRQEFFEPGPGGPGAGPSGWGGGYSGGAGSDNRSAGDTSYSQSSTLGPYAGGAVATSSPTSPVGGVGSGQWSGPGRISVINTPAITAPIDGVVAPPITDVPTPPVRPLDALVGPTSAGLPSLVGAQEPNLTGAVPGFSNPNPYGAVTGLTGPVSNPYGSITGLSGPTSTGLDWGAPTSGTFPGQGPLGGYDPQPISSQSPADYSAAMAALADAVKANMGGLGNFSRPLSGGVDPRAAGLMK
jgi:hypothetical protein